MICIDRKTPSVNLKRIMRWKPHGGRKRKTPEMIRENVRRMCIGRWGAGERTERLSRMWLVSGKDKILWRWTDSPSSLGGSIVGPNERHKFAC